MPVRAFWGGWMPSGVVVRACRGGTCCCGRQTSGCRLGPNRADPRQLHVCTCVGSPIVISFRRRLGAFLGASADVLWRPMGTASIPAARFLQRRSQVSTGTTELCQDGQDISTETCCDLRRHVSNEPRRVVQHFWPAKGIEAEWGVAASSGDRRGAAGAGESESVAGYGSVLENAIRRVAGVSPDVVAAFQNYV